MIYLNKKEIYWRTAETSEYTIDYIDQDGKSHDYHPDFFIENRYIVALYTEYRSKI